MGTTRLRSVVMIAVFDVGGPLIAYNQLRSAGLSTVTALVLSGVLPAVGVAVNIIRHRRVDALGVLVLAGIALGAVLGLAGHNAKLVLDEGSVTTAAFGLLCFGSLAAAKPLMYRLALEFIGPDSPQGREFADFWQYEAFRHTFRVLTVVWGVGYLAEAVARVIIVQNTSAGTALAVSKVMPFAVAGVLMAWTFGYGQHRKRVGERMAAAAEAAEAAETAAAAVAATAATSVVAATAASAAAHADDADVADLDD